MARPSGLVLAIETAADVGGVALLDGERPVSEVILGPEGSPGAELLPAVDRALREAGCSLDAVADVSLSVGPGSFTGLRVGLATALGLCFGTSRRIVPVPTLAALSLHAAPASCIAPLLDARKGQVYAGLYGPSATEIEKDRVIDPLEWLESLRGKGPIAFLGPGAHLYRNEIETTLGRHAQLLPREVGWPRPATVGRLGHWLRERGLASEPALVELRYLRRAEAEEARVRRPGARGSLDTSGGRA
jgi:tRNA threonylcarbamoyladenosine biosynthesis protein TsaB